MRKSVILNPIYKRIISSFLFVFIFVFIISPRFAEAAKLDVIPTFGSVNVGDNIKIRVVLSSADQSANAISGSVLFSKNLLTLNSISKSDSLISLWPVEPSYSNTSGTANFEGVVLNGYKGSSGTIITLFFKAKASGTAEVKFSNASVLANDGQGTPILSSTGEARFDIAELKEKVVPQPVDVTVPSENTNKITATLQVEEIKKTDDLDPRSRFLITSTNIKKGATYQINLDNTPYVWNDSGTHIFETVPLSKGIHSLKVSIETVNSEIISKSISFANSSILTPQFTDYSNDIVENEYIVVKGIADPSTFIIISSDVISSKSGETKHESVTIKSNEKGLFTYVSENRAMQGVYMISAGAKSSDGIESATSVPIRISVNEKLGTLTDKLTNIFSTVVPLVSVLVILIFLIIFGWYRIMHYKEHVRKRLLTTRALVDKSFSILEEDLDEETKILKKVKALKPLTAEEKEFVTQFKKDLESAERAIEDDIKNSNKGI